MVKKRIRTDDGIDLSVHEFVPEKKKDLDLNIIIAPATGITQRFYKDLALFLCSEGYKVITFDFRDLGESKIGRMKDSKASFSIWALKDFKAVFDSYLKEQRTAVIGHSFGALAFTIQENANEALGLYAFGSGTGHVSHMSFLEGVKALFLWHILLPIALYINGFLPGKISGLGSHIPKHVCLEWRKWCSMKRFWLDDPHFKYKTRTASLCVPIKVTASSDDPWTPVESAKSYYGNFNKNQTTFNNVQVSDNKQVKHIGYFLKENQDLFWTDILSWLAKF